MGHLPTFDILSVLLADKSCSYLGCFSTYAKIQKLERSARTRFKPGERPNLSSSRPSPATFQRAWWGCTTGESSCRSLPNGTSPLRGSLHILDTQTDSGLRGDPSSRSGHKSSSSNTPNLHTSGIHSEHIFYVTRSIGCEFLGLLYVYDAGRPLRWVGPSRFLYLSPCLLPPGRPALGPLRHPSCSGWILQNLNLQQSLGPHELSGGSSLSVEPEGR